MEFFNLASQTVSYNTYWEKKLSELSNSSNEIIIKENESYTSYLAEIILQFVKVNNLFEIDAVLFSWPHIIHQPQKGYTFQMGNEKN